MTLRSLFLLSCCLGATLSLLGQATIVSGVVLDARQEQPLPYVTVQFGDGQLGVRTDIHGRFLLESNAPKSQVKISYLGYEPQTLPVRPGERNELRVLLSEVDKQLLEITIRPEKYRRKNPATDLIEEVFKHKDQNRKEGLPYCNFEKYERLRFDLNGITDKFRNKWYFKRFQFIFDYCDTNRTTQKIALPFYFRERLLESYYRRDPSGQKDRLMAERQTAFDDDYDVDRDGVSTYLNSMYTDIDIYNSTITLLDKQFIGPLSGAAPLFYRFYITDTVEIGTERFADVFFAPKNKNDLAFMGNMLVALDSSYAVRRVEMGISKDINLNWVADLRIEQDFGFQGDSTNRRLLLRNDMVRLDMKIWKNKDGRSLLATKNTSYQKYSLNKPLPDSLFAGKTQLLRDTGNLHARRPEFWTTHRHDSLSASDAAVAAMIQRLKATRTFKLLEQFGMFVGTGYHRIGRVELGELGNFYTFNDVEGNRFQFTARTSDRYFKRMRLRAYAAYGTNDQMWKYGGRATFAFKGARVGRFPANQIRFSYDQDLYYPGLGSSSGEGLLGSIQRGTTNRLLLNRLSHVEYAREYRGGFSYAGYLRHRIVSGAGVLNQPDTTPQTPTDAVSTETGGWLRYAPNERFYQGANRRTQISSRWPVFFLQYRAGLKGVLGGDYAFQRASFRADKAFYVAPFGKSEWSFEMGQVFGRVSYPLLEIHRANQTYFFDDYGFNLMNHLEFVSDRFAMLHINHDFGGILLNRIPLVKKFKWREGLTFKALYGSLSNRNIPTPSNGLLPFPTDANNRPITRGLGRQPYLELSAGVGNIFGILRIDYVWRLTYRDAPDISRGGVRLLMGVGF